MTSGKALPARLGGKILIRLSNRNTMSSECLEFHLNTLKKITSFSVPLN